MTNSPSPPDPTNPPDAPTEGGSPAAEQALPASEEPSFRLPTTSLAFDAAPPALTSVEPIAFEAAAVPLSRPQARRIPWHLLVDVAFLKTLALIAAVGASVGNCLYALVFAELWPEYIIHNQISAKHRYWVQWAMVAGGLVAALLVWLVERKFGKRFPGAGARAIRRWSPLAMAGLVPLLADSRSFEASDMTVLVLVPLFGWGLYKTICLSQGASPVWGSVAVSLNRRSLWQSGAAFLQRQRNLPLILVLAGVAGYTLYFSFHTIQTHYRFGTSSFDMGLEDNLVWNATRWGPLFKMSPFGGPDATHAGNHQTYFAYVLALVYRFFPGPETLLVLQALLMGAAAIPLFFITRRALGPWAGGLLAYLYLLYPPLHGANLYDFHYLPLGTVFLWAAVSAAETRRYVWMVVALILAASVREDVNAMMAALGFMMVIEGKQVKAGLVMTALGGFLFGLLKFVVMPRYTGGHQSFLHQYQDLVPPGGNGYPAVLVTVFTNPFYTLTTLLERDKLYYLLQIMGPLVFFPVRRAVGLLACVVGIFFTLLSTHYLPQIQISFQYTTYWTTFVFIAVVRNLAWVRARHDRGTLAPSKAWMAAIAAALLVSSIQYGAVLDTRNAHGGFGHYRFGLLPGDHERHRQVYELIGLIPKDARVVASEMLVPHVSSRKNAYTLRTGVYDADYALFELPTRGDEGRNLRPFLEKGEFGVVDKQGHYALAKRGHKTDRNGEVMDLVRSD
ncbi:MAG: DUF2079 domain-containing protein [Deltaproteobacteria bacterium]|nr:DUF2079 domain-containing protein [Deltaproteobacteria bacterium]